MRRRTTSGRGTGPSLSSWPESAACSCMMVRPLSHQLVCIRAAPCGLLAVVRQGRQPVISKQVLGRLCHAPLQMPDECGTPAAVMISDYVIVFCLCCGCRQCRQSNSWQAGAGMASLQMPTLQAVLVALPLLETHVCPQFVSCAAGACAEGTLSRCCMTWPAGFTTCTA